MIYSTHIVMFSAKKFDNVRLRREIDRESSRTKLTHVFLHDDSGSLGSIIQPEHGSLLDLDQSASQWTVAFAFRLRLR